MIIDIIVLIVIFVSALISFLRGFIRETLTIVGTLGAFAAAYFFGPVLAPSIANLLGVDPSATITEPQRLFGLIPYDLLATILAYGSIFIVMIIILSILSHTIAETAKSIGLGAVDRSLGVVFGLLRAIIILGLLNLPIYIFANNEENRIDFINQEINTSNSYIYIEQVSAFIETFIPKESANEMLEESQQAIKEINIEPQKQKIIDTLIQNNDKKETETDSKDNFDTKGYSDDFRNKMDKLFEEKTDDQGE